MSAPTASDYQRERIRIEEERLEGRIKYLESAERHADFAVMRVVEAERAVAQSEARLAALKRGEDV